MGELEMLLCTRDRDTLTDSDKGEKLPVLGWGCRDPAGKLLSEDPRQIPEPLAGST